MSLQEIITETFVRLSQFGLGYSHVHERTVAPYAICSAMLVHPH